MTNAEGPAIQAVRDINPNALDEADGARRASASRTGLARPAARHPGAARRLDRRPGAADDGRLDRAAELASPTKDSTIVAKLKAAGAIILGKTNVSELNGVFDSNMPEGYSSLGGQVLLPSDTDNTPGRLVRRLGGSDGLRPGGDDRRAWRPSTDTAQMIAPAGIAGVVALKPTVGRVSRDGRAAGGQVAGLAGPDHPDGLRRGRCSCRRSPASDPDDPATVGRAGGAELPRRPHRRRR